MKKIFMPLLTASLLFLLSSCFNTANQSEQPAVGAIVLGDTNTIVTEKDSNYLNDVVSDMMPKELVSSAASPAKQAVESPKKLPEIKPAPAETAQKENGFVINFGHGVQFSLTGMSMQEFQQQNPEKDAGLSYAVSGGDLTSSKMVISGLSEVKVMQRYQSYLVLESGGDKLSLQNMGGYLSDWKQMSLHESVGQSSLLLNDFQALRFKSFSQRTLENAVRRAAQSSRMNRSDLNSWLQKIRRTKSATDAPCKLKLDNVQWRISGKTKDGHSFFKTIRVDAK